MFWIDEYYDSYETYNLGVLCEDYEKSGFNTLETSLKMWLINKNNVYQI